MVERLKSLNNYLDARIEQALRAISKRQLSDEEATEVVFLVRMSNEIERLGDLGADLGEFFRRTSGNGNGAPAPLVKKTDGVYRILDENIVGLGLLFPKILNATVAELRGRDVELQHAINERYREQLVSLKREGAFADSRYLEVLSIIEAANAKVRDLRKLAEQYSREKTAGTASVGLDDPLSLRNPVAGDDQNRVPDLPVERCVPRVDVEEGGCGEFSGRGDHNHVP